MVKEVEEANHKAIYDKEAKRQKERDLDSKIMEYNRQKAQREADRAAEEKAIKDEKEREVQKLRDMQ